MNDNVIFCSRCGAQNPAQASFCQKCGAGLGTSLPTPTQGAPVAYYAPAGSSAGYGGFWIRLVAWIIDAIVVGIASIPIRVFFAAILHLPRYRMGPYYDGHLGPLLFAVPFVFGANEILYWLYEGS